MGIPHVQLEATFRDKFEQEDGLEVYHHLQLYNPGEFIEALQDNDRSEIYSLIASYLEAEDLVKTSPTHRDRQDFAWNEFTDPRPGMVKHYGR